MLEFRRRGLELHRSCHVHESHRDFYLMHRCGGSMQETTIEKIRTHYNKEVAGGADGGVTIFSSLSKEFLVTDQNHQP